MAIPKVPDQCAICTSMIDGMCNIYEQLPGEYSREDVVDCPSFFEKSCKDDLGMLVSYLDEEEGSALLDTAISKAVTRILQGYEEKFKVMVVGIARRKIKAMLKMTDIIDIMLDKLSDREELNQMTTSQSLRLLSELNNSVNNDLNFVMKLVNPETKLADLQAWVDARSVININTGSSELTEFKADEILKLSSTSRDKIRDAFDTMLSSLRNDDVVSTAFVVEGDDNEEY